MGSKVRIGSMNARGLADPVKRRDVFEWLKRKDLEIVCLQDTHLKGEQIKKYEDEWGGKCILNTYTSESRGVAILVKKGLDCTIEEIGKDEGGNLLQVRIKVCGLDFVLTTIYGPNRDNPKFFQQLGDRINQFSELPNIICGDWNLVLDQEMDTINYVRENNVKARRKVLDIIESAELVDIWRVTHPDLKQFTWKNTKNVSQRARLDFFLTSSDVCTYLRRCDIDQSYRTDHRLISIELDKINWKKGRGFWKLNTGLLSDKTYIDMVKQIVIETADRYRIESAGTEEVYSIDPHLLWETIKLEIRGKTVQYNSRKNRKEREREDTLNKEIAKLEHDCEDENKKDKVEELNKQIQEKQIEIENLRRPKIKALMRRARAEYYEEGEKPTKFFMDLERKNYTNKLITKLNVDDRVVEDPKEILEEQKKYYETLYSSKLKGDTVQITKLFLNKRGVKKLSDIQRQKCEGMITEMEAIAVIKNMKNNKTPGTDGLPAEFYKIFWHEVKPFLIRSLNHSMNKGELSICQKQGIITCLPKTESNREFMKNWRPITLLNLDYKILSGVLSQRMREVLKDIIGHEQKGFLEGRYIGESTRMVYDIMHYLEAKKRKGLIMLIDFEKAFDSVEWEYISKVLDSYGFGEDFKKWYQILYKDSQSCVINGGHFSPFFNLKRGCRQGDPLSPYIFILAIEPLAKAIKQDTNIKGIKVKGQEYKLGQYADDMFTLLDGSEGSLAGMLELLDKFSKCSGLNVNIEKTKVVWLGVCKNSIQKLCPHIKLKWERNFKLLGIKFHINLDKMKELNYGTKLGEIKNLLSMYQKRHLSLIGKVMVIKTLAIPKLLHILSVLPSPNKTYLDNLEGMFRKFIWNNGKGRISYEQLCGSTEAGGLKLTNIRILIKALRISWIKRLIQGEGDWQDLFKNTITSDYNLIWELDTESMQSFSDKVSNSFWREVFVSWSSYIKDCRTQNSDCAYYPIWNSNICQTSGLLKDKKALQEKGLLYVKDIFSDNGDILGYEEFKTKYMPINFVSFYGLVHSLSREWRIEFSNVQMCDIKNVIKEKLDTVLSKKKVCKYVYSEMQYTKTLHSNSENKWSNILGTELSETECKNMYKIPIAVTTANKLRSFQYQILKRSLVTNKFLHMCKIKDNDLCYFCNQACETIDHLLFDCYKIQLFWKDLINVFGQCLELHRYVHKKAVIIGVQGTETDVIVNFLLITVKRYIYVTRCLKRKLSIIHYLNILADYYRTEHYNANLKGNFMKCISKWAPVLSVFDALEIEYNSD